MSEHEQLPSGNEESEDELQEARDSLDKLMVENKALQGRIMRLLDLLIRTEAELATYRAKKKKKEKTK